MDIHKPKPWHGLREFLKEYLIIVVGVLTALGGEQLVEWSQRVSAIREAREALHAELSTNSTTASFGIQEVKCLAGQLGGFEAWARGGPHAEEVRASFPPMTSSTWDAVKTGAVPHMPLKERLSYSHYYDDVDNMRWVTENERGVYLRIAGLVKRDKLSPEDGGRLIEDINQARLVDRVRADNVSALIEMTKALGVEPKPFSESDKADLTRICGRPFKG